MFITIITTNLIILTSIIITNINDVISIIRDVALAGARRHGLWRPRAGRGARERGSSS